MCVCDCPTNQQTKLRNVVFFLFCLPCESLIRMQDPQNALTQFEQILRNHPTSAAAQYGLAKALDHLADLNHSNELLKKAINEYQKYIGFGAKLNDTEFKTAAERCIERMRFIGNVNPN